MKPGELLDLPLPENDSGESTVRGYLLALLAETWLQGSSFNVKRPFGNSSWQYQVYVPMAAAGLINGIGVDEDGELDYEDRDFWAERRREADSLILTAISALGRPAGNGKRPGNGNGRGGMAASGSGARGGTGKLRSGSGAGPGVPRNGRPQSPKRRADTEPSASIRKLVLERDGYRCVICGISVIGIIYSIHHRRNRASGGTSLPDANLPVNLLTVCGSGTTGDHGWLTQNGSRKLALDKGWIVPVNGIAEHTTPALIPVQVAWLGKRYATEDGRWAEELGEAA